MSVYKRKSGRYAVLIDLESTALGGRRRKSVGTFRTRKEAEAAERKALQQRDDGIDIPTAHLTVRTIVQRYIDRCRAKGLAPTTTMRYDSLAKPIFDAFGDVVVTKLSPASVAQMYAQCQSNVLSPKSIRHVHGLLHAALEWAVQMNLVIRNVASIAACDLPKLKKSPARALTETEAQQLLEAAKGSPWYAFFTLAICSGARRGELAALRWSSIDFENKRMTIDQSLTRTDDGQKFKEPKTGLIRTVPLNRLATATLQWHKLQQNRDRKRAGGAYDEGDLVFADPLGEASNLTAITNAFGRIAKDAGVHARLHDLRHSCASWMLQSGIDIRTVAGVLGHSSPVTTLGTYSHLMPGAEAKAVDAIAARLEAAAS